jgi:hypothetical protein
MPEKEKFAYQIDMGAVMDFADGRFILAFKDDDWNEEQLALFQEGLDVNFGWWNGIAFFVVEGGPLDSADLYFNIQDCDQADSLLALEQIPVELVLVNEKDEVCGRKYKLLDAAQSAILHNLLAKQKDMAFGPNEFDVNMEGLMNAYEPFELNKFSQLAFKL